jgi:hypothetical protein
LKKTVANKGKRPTTLTRGAVKRIARAVNAYERGDRDIPARKFRSYGVGGDSGVRLCNVGASGIGKNATAEIEVLTDPAQTVEVENKLTQIGANRKVLIAQNEDDNKWYVVEAEQEALEVITSVELVEDALVFTLKRIWVVVADTEISPISIPVTECEGS